MNPSGQFYLDADHLRKLRLRLFCVLVGCEAILAFLHMAITWAPKGTYHILVFRMFHMDREANFPTWFSSAQLLLVGLVLLLIFALERRHSPNSWAVLVWLLSAIGVIFLSADETAKIHEFLGTWFDEVFDSAQAGTFLHTLKSFPSYYWALAYVPIAIPAQIFLSIFFWKRLAEARWMAIAGMMVFVVGAVLLDHLEGRFGNADHLPLPIQLFDVNFRFDIFLFEELLEMLGVTMILFALAEHASKLMLMQPGSETAASQRAAMTT